MKIFIYAPVEEIHLKYANRELLIGSNYSFQDSRRVWWASYWNKEIEKYSIEITEKKYKEQLAKYNIKSRSKSIEIGRDFFTNGGAK